MNQQPLSLPQQVFERLNNEAQRRQVEIADLILNLLDEPKLARRVPQNGATILGELIALAPQMRGPRDLSHTYEQLLYGTP